MIEIEDITRETEKKVKKIIKSNFIKGNKYLLWKLKQNEKIKYSYFTIIKDIKETGKTSFELHLVDYRLSGASFPEKENSSEIEDISVPILGLNTKSYEIFLLTEKEAKPYLKIALVMSLENEPKKIEV